jgi:hypothetical protein
MDHIRALNLLRSRQTLSTALSFAIFDRRNSDYFCNLLEIEHAEANRDVFLNELVEELREAARYTARTAFAYFPPKNELCERRLIYLPLKDLTVRFAFALIFSNEIESAIHPECFANRRAQGEDGLRRFTENFATGGWARFCAWQRTQCGQNQVLLKTDISSFYDSISHEYLIDSIRRHLGLPGDCDLLVLFRRIMQIPVIHYSPRTGEIEGPFTTHQGLPLGDGAEGYLANLYLKDVDDAMIQSGAHYGRYVDDIRIFGQTRSEVVRQLRILQEQLLRKGLNLNSSKTEIAENSASQAGLASRIYLMADYEVESEEAGSAIPEQIDAPLQEFSRTFTEADTFQRGKDAKDFCRFLSGHAANGSPLVALADRTHWHVDRLRQTIVTWRGPTKHAAWLLVQTATYRGVAADVQSHARATLLGLLLDEAATSYARCRVLHHLVKLRQGGAPRPFRLFDSLPASDRSQIVGGVRNWLPAPAFELNLMALYLMRVGGVSIPVLQGVVGQHCRTGCVPARDAVSEMAEVQQASSSSDAPQDEGEADETPSPY